MHSDQAILSDTVRLESFRAALRACVKPGDTVLDAGTGTGVLAVMAVQAGASRVYAVDTRGIINLARSVAEANACADRITFIHGDVREVCLPERVHGVVCELLGYAGLAEGIAGILARVTDQHLLPGGWRIPRRVRVCAAPVQHPAMHRDIMLHGALPGVNLEPVRDEIAQNYWVDDLAGARLLAPEQTCVSLDWDEPGRGPFRGNDPVFTLEQDGTLHGFGAWFSADLAPGVVLDTAPQAPPTSWRQVLFPLRDPVPVRAGDTLAFELTTLPMACGDMFHWRCDLSRNGDAIYSAAHSNTLTFQARDAFSNAAYE